MAVEFNDANFKKEVLENEKVTLVDFWAPWCGPCQMMGPVIDEVATEIGDLANVGKLNVDENQESAQKYGVMSIPTIIIFKDGKNVKQLVGAQSKEVLIEELKKA